MSKFRYWWYEIVKKAIKFANAEPACKENVEYLQASKKAFEDLEKLPEVKERTFAINEILIYDRSSKVAVSEKIHYSPRTIQRWLISFIVSVGKYKGFK